MKAIVTLYQDTRRAKSNGKYPVKIRVYLDTKTKYYPIKRDLTEIEFKNAYLSQKPRKEYRELKLKLQIAENKAAKIADALDPFTFEKFERRMFRRTGDANNVVYYYAQYIAKLKAEGREGTASNYDLSLKSIENFLDMKKDAEFKHIPFDDITPEILNRYEKWMQKGEKSLTTVGIYLRPLRCIFNLAIEEGDIPAEIYPFGKRKYQIPAGRNIKKALSKKDLKTLYTYKVPKGSYQQKARDFWFFSYQCNGMNIRDIAELRYKNIQGDTLTFTRSKTKNTTKANSKPIIVPLSSIVKEAIKKYGNKKISGETYVFPIFSEGITELEKLKNSKNFTKFINQHLKKLAEDAGVTTEISTYWARHSYTTSAMRNGASLEFIQESLGHEDMKTTMNYWSGFEDSVKRDISKKLMDFS